MPQDPNSKAALYRSIRSLMEALIVLRSRFGNDLDQFLVYLVFALGPLGAQLLRLQTEASEAGLNVLSISEITGIPRESTRRKLHRLSVRGAVRRDDDGLWRLEGAADIAYLQRRLAPLIEAVSALDGPSPVLERQAA